MSSSTANAAKVEHDPDHPASLLPATTGVHPDPAPAGLAGHLTLWLLAPAVIGIAAGASVAAFTWLTTDHGIALLASIPGSWPALFNPLALIVTLGMTVWITRTNRPSTSELYATTYFEPGSKLPLRQIPGRVLGAMTTVGFGGSQGLESASALMGATFGQIAGSLKRGGVSEDHRRTLLACGAGAGIAAVFSSPSLGTLYGLELPFRRDVDARRLVASVIAAAAGFTVRSRLIGPHHLVVMDDFNGVDARFVFGVFLLAVTCGLGAHLFALAGEWLKHIGTHETRLARALTGGILLAALAWAAHRMTGAWITFGPGYLAADWLVTGYHPLWIVGIGFLIRSSGTLICVYGGGGGGVFTSLACSGAFIGQFIGQLVGQPQSHVFPFLGMACFLASGYRIPLACIMLVCEQSHSMPVVTAGMTAIAVGQILMGRDSVSDAKHRDRMD